MNRSWLDLKKHMRSKHNVLDANSYDFSRGGMFVSVYSNGAMDDVFLRKESGEFHRIVKIAAPGRYNLEEAELESNRLNEQVRLPALQSGTSGGTRVVIPSTKYVSNVRTDYRCGVIFDHDFDNDDEAKSRCEAMNQTLGGKYLQLIFINPSRMNLVDRRKQKNLGGITSARS